MLGLLREFASDDLHKLACFDEDAQDVDPCLIEDPPHLCFIDGEHTNRAVVSDFEFCYSVCAPNAVIAFHDMNIVHGGLETIVERLRKQQVEFKAGPLGGFVYVVALGDSGIVNERNGSGGQSAADATRPNGQPRRTGNARPAARGPHFPISTAVPHASP